MDAIPSTSGNRPTDKPGWTAWRRRWRARHYVPVTNGGGGSDGYMRNYGLAQFQREAKKKPPQYVMTHIWLTSLRKSQKERERKRVKLAWHNEANIFIEDPFQFSNFFK